MEAAIVDIEMCSEKHILITDQDIFKLGELADTIVNSTVAKYLPGRTKNLNNLEYKLYKLAGYDQLLAERKKRATINGASCYTTKAYGLSQIGFQRIIKGDGVIFGDHKAEDLGIGIRIRRVLLRRSGRCINVVRIHDL